MLLGFAVTQHCNLRCPHCIRDDVTTVRSLDADFVLSVTDQARELFGDVTTSLTGGEPLLHPQFGALIDGFAARAVPYRFVSNGWHMKRVLPLLDRYPPLAVRLSLSGADELVHDAERGRGSFRRVLLAVALLTSRQTPTWLSIIIDRRTRHQVRAAADLAEWLGCSGLQFTLPQPVPGSVVRDTDLPPDEWWGVSEEVAQLAAEPGRRTLLEMSYGHPAEQKACTTFDFSRVYVDAFGRLSLCCQLSDYGSNEADVVADLRTTPLREAWPMYLERLAALRTDADRVKHDANDSVAAFPCLRCARACGKLDWLKRFPQSEWGRLEQGRARALPVLAVAV